MGMKPGERLMGLLEGRAEAISGEFTTQEVASTLWATSFLSILNIHNPGRGMPIFLRTFFRAVVS